MASAALACGESILFLIESRLRVRFCRGTRVFVALLLIAMSSSLNSGHFTALSGSSCCLAFTWCSDALESPVTQEAFLNARVYFLRDHH